MENILIVKLCAQESYDTGKITNYFSQGNTGAKYISLLNESLRLARNKDLIALSPRFVELVEMYKKDSSIFIFDLTVLDIEIFKRMGKILKNWIKSDLKILVIIDHPIKHFDDFVFRPVNSVAQEANERNFFGNSLYRVDKILSIAEQIGDLSIAAGSSLENEKQFFEFAGFKWDKELEKIPVPTTHAAKDVNRFFSLPKMSELFTLPEWRKITAQFDGGVTRIVSVEKIEELERLVQRYWRMTPTRYPALKKALSLDVESMKRASPYTGLDIKKLVSLLPKEIANHFGYLRHGFTPFFNQVLNEFDDIRTDDAPAECTVITFAYNQEKYIAECIESVARQKTDRKIEHVILDDCSTDNTPSIIMEYAGRYAHIKPVLFKKKPLTTIGPAFQSCRSRYVALCDGDDYFTDQNKLETQMKFLETYPDFSMCFHFANVTYEDGAKPHIFPEKGSIKQVSTLADLLQGNYIQTSSVMYRWRFTKGLPYWFNPFLRPGDWYWHVLHAETGPVAFIPKVMSCYRRHGNAVYATAELQDKRQHFLVHGLREMEVFDELDQHFNGRYHKDFSTLAQGVFARIFMDSYESGNLDKMEKASLMFPKFFSDFKKAIQ